MDTEDNTVKSLNFPIELFEAAKLRGLKFINRNIRSLRGKLSEFIILTSKFVHLHILSFTESWLNDDTTDDEIALPVYNIFRSDRQYGIGGGIVEYIRDSIFAIRRTDLESQ